MVSPPIPPPNTATRRPAANLRAGADRWKAGAVGAACAVPPASAPAAATAPAAAIAPVTNLRRSTPVPFSSLVGSLVLDPAWGGFLSSTAHSSWGINRH